MQQKTEKQARLTLTFVENGAIMMIEYPESGSNPARTVTRIVNKPEEALTTLKELFMMYSPRMKLAGAGFNESITDGVDSDS